MSQDDMNVANSDGATVRADINSQLGALITNSSGATAPPTTFAFQTWADTANDLMKIRNSGNSAWIVLFKLSTGGFELGADIISANALPVLADGVFNDVTGTTGITSINTLGIGTIKWLQFDATVTITHDATKLILPGGKNIVTVAGDVLCFYEYASGDWRLISNSADSFPYRKGADIISANALPVLDSGAFDVTGTTAITSINSVGVGAIILLQFDAIVTVTHDATDLILPNALNITTVAGQILVFHEYASGDWRLVSNSLVGGVSGDISVTSLTLTGTVDTDANTLTSLNIIAAHGSLDNSSGTPAWNGTQYNFTASFTDNGAGDTEVFMDTDMANTTYTVVASVDSAVNRTASATNKAAGSVDILVTDDSGVAQDEDVSIIIVGGQ